MFITGLSFLLRLLGIVISVVAVLGALLLAIIIINRLVTLILDQIGIEIFDTGRWVTKKIEKVRKNARRKNLES